MLDRSSDPPIGTVASHLAAALRDFDFAHIMLLNVWPDAPHELQEQWRSMVRESSIRLRQIGFGTVSQLARYQAIKLGGKRQGS